MTTSEETQDDTAKQDAKSSPVSDYDGSSSRTDSGASSSSSPSSSSKRTKNKPPSPFADSWPWVSSTASSGVGSVSSPTKGCAVAADIDRDSQPQNQSQEEVHHVVEAEEEREIPHVFEDCSFRKPTNCDICNGLLVGLWSQGLQCKLCKMNIHRGEGIDGHDDCRAEALMLCCGKKPYRRESLVCEETTDGSNGGSSNAALTKTQLQFKTKAKEDPFGLIKDIKAQIDRDLMAHTTKVVVTQGVENERARKLKRLKAKVQYAKGRIEQFEASLAGEIQITMFLLLVDSVLSVIFAALTYIFICLALLPLQYNNYKAHGPEDLRDVIATTTNSTSESASMSGMVPNPTTSILKVAWLHATTICWYIQTSVWLFSLLAYRLGKLFHRKTNIINQFLIDVVDLDAQKDLGISIDGLSTLLNLWCRRILKSSSLSLLIIVLIWLRQHNSPLYYIEQ